MHTNNAGHFCYNGIVLAIKGKTVFSLKKVVRIYSGNPIMSHIFNPDSFPAHLTVSLFLLITVFLLIGTSCKTPEPVMEEQQIDMTPLESFFNESDVFKQSMTGFALFDPEQDSLIHNHEAHRYYTPASNTKLFTLYAALNILPDTLPSLRYHIRNDTLFFRGTGDPTFLNPNFDNNTAFEFLKNREETLVYNDSHFEDHHFGSGWPWDWYPAPYAPEKAPFPIYGNVVRMQTQQVALIMLNEDQPVKPAFFEKYLENRGWNSNQLSLVDREFRENRFLYAPKADTARQERMIPFVYSSELFVELLADTLEREIGYSNDNRVNFDQTLNGIPADTVYRRLMLNSDNLVGEQLLLMISDHLFGRMDAAQAINYSVGNFMNSLPDTPRWSDGSGLTRYNLMTPRSIVVLLDKLYDEYGEEKIMPMFPAGGERGTISGRYAPPEGEPPFVFAKTGTLRNNNALSGYVFTNSGRRLIFSFVNNNFVVSGNAILSEMENALNVIRETY
jgi:serine-type D-Ala-D-Ala carboxypeptidase/endopeptidase (penicillin-binding protein 4)